jgi:BirA family transcriptional regulator, biotin operon repressor / biotin---[acetyl-CoA-carboxylase] ligase
MPLDLDSVRRLRPTNNFQYFQIIDSTMTAAARLVEAGLGEGTVVIAEEQTSGLGRRGRSWISNAEVGIYCSVLLHLPLISSQLPVASLLIGLATAEAIEKATHLSCDLRWPNDILIRERKVAGILPQLVNHCVVAGIGINVNNTGFPAGLRTPATSLLLSSGRLQSRENLLVRLLESLDSFSELLAAKGPQAILRAFSAASSYVADRRVIVEESGLRGTTAGLDEQGFLLFRSDNGQTSRISSGSIRKDLEGATI